MLFLFENLVTNKLQSMVCSSTAMSSVATIKGVPAMMGRWLFVVMLSALLSSSAFAHAGQFNSTRLYDVRSGTTKAEHGAGKYGSPGEWSPGCATNTIRPGTLSIPVIAANTVHYYDAHGNEVPESEFKKIVKKHHEPSRAKDHSRPGDVAPGTFEARTKKHFLWTVETNQNTVYFLGSVHMLTSNSYPLAREIEHAYKDCQEIVFETDLDGLNDPIQQGKMAMVGLYPFGQTLQQNLSEETYTALKKRVEAAGMSMTAFDHLKPWMCALTLAVMELQRLGLDPNLGIDTYFFDKAKRDGKERTFLEPVEYQLNLFAKMDEEEQESFLRQTLEELEILETMALDMVRAWKTGDVEKLALIIGTTFQEHPDIYNRLVIERNRKWVAKIEDLLHQDDNVLIIVGAAHMVGTENILELLKRRGHKITQSASSPETASVFRQEPVRALSCKLQHSLADARD